MALLTQKNNDNQESPFKKIAKDTIKNQAKKHTKKIAKKLFKKGIKLAGHAIKKLGLVLIKFVISLLGAIGIPTLLVIGACILVFVIVSLTVTTLFSNGEDLEESQKEIFKYIQQRSEASIDPDIAAQRPYKVPVELITAFVQLEAMTKEDEKQAIYYMAENLEPEFYEGLYNEFKQTQKNVCREDPVEKTKKCTEGEVNQEDNYVTYYNYIAHWQGEVHIEYEKYLTDWTNTVNITYETKKYEVEEEVEVEYEELVWDEKSQKHIKVKKKKKEMQKVEKEKKIKVTTTTKVRHQKFHKYESYMEDYSRLDAVLEKYGLTLNDKRLLEVNYLFVGGKINYINWLDQRSGGSTGYVPYQPYSGTVIPGEGVPPQYMEYYLAAEVAYGVPWYTLAAIHFVETGFSTHPTMISSAGALGHTQFLPATWVGWKYNIGGGLVSSSTDITNLQVIAAGRGYGVDGDRDGRADPFNLWDAIFTTAHYLAKSGYEENSYKAIFNYNRADWYVKKVLDAATKFEREAKYTPADGKGPADTGGTFTLPTQGRLTSPFGPRSGKLHAGVDIAQKSVTPVVAAADGVVVRSYFSQSYGNCIILRHNINGQQYETLYAHLQSRTVSDGNQVTRGQFLGNMGNTGRSSGQHLHFEIHKGSWNISKSNAQNPAFYIPLDQLGG